MKQHTLLACLTGITTLLISSLSWAEPTLDIPKSADLLLLNGQETETQSPLTLRQGKNQIVFKYNTRFRQQGQQQRFTSEAIILSFEADNQSYNFKLPKLKSAKDADDFNSAPVIELTDANGETISYHSDVLIKEGLQLGRDYGDEISVYNLSGADAAIIDFAVKQQAVADSVTIAEPSRLSPVVTTPGTTQKKQIPEQINVGQMLDFWYSQADEETRKAFKARIKDK
ncbi:DUF2057 domain-containing protein [uncultured Shewanella sp.]|uniref:YccT family protein n=1 Tax=Shewanella atlantica TaxID=271099 RepID=UPI002631C351|nr:DUF2057 domain-containing protein [uncultured Shewanella sp.]